MLNIRVNVTGFNPNDENRLHGIHIHEYGDLSNGCSSAGGHYNPLMVNHGAPTNSRIRRWVSQLGFGMLLDSEN